MSIRRYDTTALGLLKKEKELEEEEERRMLNRDFFLLRARAYVKLRSIAMLYTHSIGNQPYIEHDGGV